jgi:membrane protein required for colicin V production
MGDGPITVADGAVLAVLVLSGLFAFVRGFSREVLTIAAWGLAIAILIIFYEPAQEWARASVGGGIVTDVAVALLLFVMPLLVLSLASRWACKQMQARGIGAADRTLGFLFGIVRGLAAVVLLYWMYTFVDNPADPPGWVTKSKLYPVVAAGANYIHPWLPEMAAPVRTKRIAQATPDSEFIPAGATDSTESSLDIPSGTVQQDGETLEHPTRASEGKDEEKDDP